MQSLDFVLLILLWLMADEIVLTFFFLAGLLRCGKSCRLRWINYLRPDLKRGNITEEEDRLIIKLHSVLGNR